MQAKTPLFKLVARRLVKTILPRSAWNRLRRARIERVIREFRPRVVSHTYAGYPFRVKLADPLSESWHDRDWGEYPEFPLLRSGRLGKGATVFDIGAHQGVVAMILGKMVGEVGKVVAVEANGHNARIAEENRKLNDITQLEILHAAAADQPGTLTFNLNLNGQVDAGEAEWGQQEVRAVTVDELSEKFGSPHVLFIDVEGFECQVLEGAERTLQGGPDCCVEVHVDAGLESLGRSVDEVMSFFPEERFDRYICPENPHDEFIPYDPESPILKERFFLVALSKQGF